MTIDGRTTAVHNERQVGTSEPEPTRTRSRHSGWAILNSTSFIASWVLMTKETLGSSEAFPTVHLPGSTTSTSHATPGLTPIFAMETTHDQSCTTHMHRLLQHQSLANLAMEPAAGTRPANTRVSAALRPGG